MSKEKQIVEMIEIVKPFVSGLACGEESGSCELTDCRSCKARNLAIKLQEECYRKQEWISVDERLPKELTHVIVCDEDGTVGEAFCYKEGRFEWMDSEELAFVTHWMPLPDAPKGGAE